MGMYKYITLREKPDLKETAAQWFHEKWGVPKEAYLELCNDISCNSYLLLELLYQIYYEQQIML